MSEKKTNTERERYIVVSRQNDGYGLRSAAETHFQGQRSVVDAFFHITRRNDSPGRRRLVLVGIFAASPPRDVSVFFFGFPWIIYPSTGGHFYFFFRRFFLFLFFHDTRVKYFGYSIFTLNSVRGDVVQVYDNICTNTITRTCMLTIYIYIPIFEHTMNIRVRRFSSWRGCRIVMFIEP